MAVSDHGKVQVVLERFGGPPTRHRLVQKRTAKPGGNLHIAERRDVRVDVRSTKDVPDGAGAIRTEQIIEERRRVGDDQSQEASRAERSSRIRSAGRLRSFTGVLFSIRSSTSAAGGLATSLSSSSWMYSVSAWPRAFARLVSSRWSRSGTFLTWIILDMRGACHMCCTCSRRVVSRSTAHLPASRGRQAAELEPPCANRWSAWSPGSTASPLVPRPRENDGDAPAD